MYNKLSHFLRYCLIAPEALPFIAIPLALACLFGVVSIFFQSGIAVAGIVSSLSATACVAYFFRDPRREISAISGYDVLSPADGTIVGIESLDEPVFMNAPSIRVSIFLSIFNVHINRIPFSGIVKYKKYNPGKFHGAYLDKASAFNENMALGIEGNGGGSIFVRQIAGFVARRIVCRAAVGEKVTVGSKYGLIKFGSRVELYLPRDTKIDSTVGDKVVAGVTIIGCMNEPKSKS